MRELDVQCIADKIAQLCVEANHYLGEDIKACIRQKAEEETWPVAKDVLASIPALSGYGHGVRIPGDRAGCASDRRAAGRRGK